MVSKQEVEDKTGWRTDVDKVTNTGLETLNSELAQVERKLNKVEHLRELLVHLDTIGAVNVEVRTLAHEGLGDCISFNVQAWTDNLTESIEHLIKQAEGDVDVSYDKELGAYMTVVVIEVTGNKDD